VVHPGICSLAKAIRAPRYHNKKKIRVTIIISCFSALDSLPCGLGHTVSNVSSFRYDIDICTCKIEYGVRIVGRIPAFCPPSTISITEVVFCILCCGGDRIMDWASRFFTRRTSGRITQGYPDLLGPLLRNILHGNS
jgi:hypothetical protein